MLETGLEDIENGILLELRLENANLNSQLNKFRNESQKTK